MAETPLLAETEYCACGHASGRKREARRGREASASGGGAPRESKNADRVLRDVLRRGESVMDMPREQRRVHL
jgi:hypothetical protein